MINWMIIQFCQHASNNFDVKQKRFRKLSSFRFERNNLKKYLKWMVPEDTRHVYRIIIESRYTCKYLKILRL